MRRSCSSNGRIGTQTFDLFVEVRTGGEVTATEFDPDTTAPRIDTTGLERLYAVGVNRQDLEALDPRSIFPSPTRSNFAGRRHRVAKAAAPFVCEAPTHTHRSHRRPTSSRSTDDGRVDAAGRADAGEHAPPLFVETPANAQSCPAEIDASLRLFASLPERIDGVETRIQRVAVVDDDTVVVIARNVAVRLRRGSQLSEGAPQILRIDEIPIDGVTAFTEVGFDAIRGRILAAVHADAVESHLVELEPDGEGLRYKQTLFQTPSVLTDLSIDGDLIVRGHVQRRRDLDFERRLSTFATGADAGLSAVMKTQTSSLSILIGGNQGVILHGDLAAPLEIERVQLLRNGALADSSVLGFIEISTEGGIWQYAYTARRGFYERPPNGEWTGALFEVPDSRETCLAQIDESCQRAYARELGRGLAVRSGKLWFATQGCNGVFVTAPNERCPAARVEIASQGDFGDSRILDDSGSSLLLLTNRAVHEWLPPP